MEFVITHSIGKIRDYDVIDSRNARNYVGGTRALHKTSKWYVGEKRLGTTDLLMFINFEWVCICRVLQIHFCEISRCFCYTILTSHYLFHLYISNCNLRIILTATTDEGQLKSL